MTKNKTYLIKAFFLRDDTNYTYMCPPRLSHFYRTLEPGERKRVNVNINNTFIGVMFKKTKMQY